VNIHFHDLQAQYRAYQQEIDCAISRVLASGQYILGPEVELLEQALAEYIGCQHAVTCANGTDALQLALMAIDIKPGDEVITTPFTFIATAEIISLLGAIPIFVDIDPQTYNIDPNKISEKVTDKTRAILPVSLYGQVADMNEINEIASLFSQQYSRKIYVIEDAAQSFGATYKGMTSGNLTDIACFSFFPTKPLGCYGDGGAITSNCDLLVEKIKMLRTHGQFRRYQHRYIGINSRLDTLQAAILNVKLQYFDVELKQRAHLAKRYNELLQPLDMILPYVKPDRTSVFAQYSIRCLERSLLIKELNARGIPLAIHYPKPLHLQECFAYLKHTVGDFPIAEQIADEIISLPMSAFLTENDQLYIVDHIHALLGYKKQFLELYNESYQ
jgi:UDP-2-acetamido-2-deoxy-ribo-hexuluronate aminotransferase